MGRNMSFDFGLENANTCFTRKNRWLLEIPEICADVASISSLPPSKAARPNISFKEIEVQHITETVYFPGRPEWKPINLTLYDIKRPGANTHPIYKWITSLYDPVSGNYTTTIDGEFKKKKAFLRLYDGCGEVIESWVYENVWPQSVEFGDLDMMSSDLLLCEITLRYDRAYIEDSNGEGTVTGTSPSSRTSSSYSNSSGNGVFGIPRPDRLGILNPESFF